MDNFESFQSKEFERNALKRKWLAQYDPKVGTKRYWGPTVTAQEIDEIIEEYEGDVEIADFHLQTLIIEGQDYNDVVLPGWIYGYEPAILLNINLDTFKFLSHKDVCAIALACKSLLKFVKRWLPLIKSVCEFPKERSGKRVKILVMEEELSEQQIVERKDLLEKEMDEMVEKAETWDPILKDPYSVPRRFFSSPQNNL